MRIAGFCSFRLVLITSCAFHVFIFSIKYQDTSIKIGLYHSVYKETNENDLKN